MESECFNTTNYINKHLKHDLRWLLCATATWELPKEPFIHVKLYSEIASFTFARSLFEFLTTSNPNKYASNVTWQDFGLRSHLESRLYKIWYDPLNKFVLHPDKRPEGNNIIGSKHLKNMPLEFAIEILMLWDEFTKQADLKYQDDLKEVKKFSILRAKDVNPDTRLSNFF